MSRNADCFDDVPPAFENPELPLAVVVASTRWDEPPRMRHHITRQLIRRFNVLFVEFFPTEAREQGTIQLRRVSDRLLIYSPVIGPRVPLRLYTNEPVTHNIVNLIFNRKLKEVLRLLKGNQPILINFSYRYPEIMNMDIFSYKAYICYDEFPKMQRRSQKGNSIRAWYQGHLFQYYENHVARRAHRCFTPHYPLRDKLRKVNNKVEMLMHAHDLALMPSLKQTIPQSKVIKVAFAGHLNWRLLPEWLVEAANQEDISLYMIGALEGKHDLSNVLSSPTVKHCPTLPEDELMQTLSEMDVLIMPYNPAIPEVSILTTNSKIFQYVATGKPVVISDLPHYLELPYGVIYKAKDRHDFITQIRKAYYEDSDIFIQLRRQVALDNTWDKRGDALFQILTQDLPNFRW